MAGISRQGKQRRLWEGLVINSSRAVKVAMIEALKGSGLSREQAADAINRLAHLAGIRRRATLAMLNKWMNPEAEQYPPPLDMLQLFCQALENYGPLAVYVGAFPGVHLVNEEEWRLLEWARVEREARKTRRQARQLAPGAGVE